MSGIAAIDIDHYTAFRPEAVQTPGSFVSKSLPDHYSEVMYQRKDQLQTLYTGLNASQARSSNKLNFHFNTSLTAINIAKIQHWV